MRVEQQDNLIIIAETVVLECENKEHADVAYPRIKRMIEKHVVAIQIPEMAEEIPDDEKTESEDRVSGVDTPSKKDPYP